MQADESEALWLRSLVESFLLPQGDAGKGKLLFCAVTGPELYNLNVESAQSSEEPNTGREIYGVYMVPTESLLGIAAGDIVLKERTLITEAGSPVTIRVDEAAKFCNLCVEGNPNALEMLHVDAHCYQSDEWLLLKEYRESLMTRLVLLKFINQGKNYLTSREKKLEKRKKFAKRLEVVLAEKKKEEGKIHKPNIKMDKERLNMRNAIDKIDKEEAAPNDEFYSFFRFLYQAQRVLRGEVVKVWLEDDSKERKQLMAVRKGEVSKAEAIEQMYEMVGKLEPKIKECSFPPNCERSLLNPWLVAVRKKPLYFYATS